MSHGYPCRVFNIYCRRIIIIAELVIVTVIVSNYNGNSSENKIVKRNINFPFKNTLPHDNYLSFVISIYFVLLLVFSFFK